MAPVSRGAAHRRPVPAVAGAFHTAITPSPSAGIGTRAENRLLFGIAADVAAWIWLNRMMALGLIFTADILGGRACPTGPNT